MTHPARFFVYFFLMVAVIVLLAAAAWPQAAQAGPGLPPRQTPPANQPDGAGPDNSDKDKDEPVMAYIEAVVEPGGAGLWTTVQWQDNAGGWHDVEGWRGAAGTDGRITWAVEAKNFGTGPFRWVVAADPAAPPLAATPPFILPHQANEWVRVKISFARP